MVGRLEDKSMVDVRKRWEWYEVKGALEDSLFRTCEVRGCEKPGRNRYWHGDKVLSSRCENRLWQWCLNSQVCSVSGARLTRIRCLSLRTVSKCEDWRWSEVSHRDPMLSSTTSISVWSGNAKERQELVWDLRKHREESLSFPCQSGMMTSATMRLASLFMNFRMLGDLWELRSLGRWKVSQFQFLYDSLWKIWRATKYIKFF